MLTNVEPMACGECGRGLFRMYHAPATHGFRLIAECSSCKSTSVIEPRPSELVIEFGDGSNGRLCRMAPNDG